MFTSAVSGVTGFFELQREFGDDPSVDQHELEIRTNVFQVVDSA